jgi:hypothetical protein
MELKTENFTLISPIDANKNISVGGKVVSRFFEDEAIRCFGSWRRHAGILKDIDIYCVHLNRSAIKDETVAKLKNLGVKYIDDPQECADDFKIGFLNEPLCGYYFSRFPETRDKISIKIDLDMQIFRPIDMSLLPFGDEIVIGQYDERSAKGQRATINGNLPFDTNYIVSRLDNGFYERYFQLCTDSSILESDGWKKLYLESGWYSIEEYVIDMMSSKGEFHIRPVQNYQFGEGYPSVDSYTDEEVETISFLHEHIYRNGEFPYDYDPIAERLRFFRRSH